MDTHSFTNTVHEEHLVAKVSDDSCRFEFNVKVSLALVKQQPEFYLMMYVALFMLY